MLLSEPLYISFGATLYIVSFLFLLGCQAGHILPASSVSEIYDGRTSNTTPRLPLYSSPAAVEDPRIEQSGAHLSIYKRRVRDNPARPNSSNVPEKTHTVRLFKNDLVYTEWEFQWLQAMLRKLPEVIASGLVGWDVDPRYTLYVRLGPLTLNLYALTEALTQSVVLAVCNRLTEMVVKGFISLGLGEVEVGAGVRVLFAAGIQLPGLQDVNEFFIQPLIG